MSQTNINQVIEKLLIVQERDVRVLRCQREIAQIPREKEAIENEINKIREQTQSAKNDVKTRHAEIKKIELEIDALRQKISKLREQQLQIKSNEEFRALNREVAALMDEIRKMEDREIAAMEQVEEARQKELSDQANMLEVEKTIKDRLRVFDDKKSALDAEIKQLQTDRDAIAKDIAHDCLKVYNRIFENKKDRALVAVENSTCTGCHMQLATHVVYDLKKNEGLVSCSFCGRLL